MTLSGVAEKFCGQLGRFAASNATIVQPLPTGSDAHMYWPFAPEHCGSAQSTSPSQLSSTPFVQFSIVPQVPPEQAPLTQVAGSQAAGVPQVPPGLHVSTPLFEHCVAPGEHTPVQLPDVQTYAHATSVRQLPVPSHVWTLPGADGSHRVLPTAQEPEQAAEPTAPVHVWFTHAVGGPQLPVASQVWMPLPEHCVAPGLQATQEAPCAPARQTGVPPVHPTAVPHVPVASHVWTPVAEHCVEPGTHDPVQLAPPALTVQTEGHGDGALHVPPLHVWTPLFEHCVAPAVHADAQTPALHTAGHVEPLGCHAPFESQICGC
jgi:hypothetical protein